MYDDVRYEMMQNATNSNDSFSNLESEEKMMFLLSNVNISSAVIKTVNKMFLKRKQAISK